MISNKIMPLLSPACHVCRCLIHARRNKHACCCLGLSFSWHGNVWLRGGYWMGVAFMHPCLPAAAAAAAAITTLMWQSLISCVSNNNKAVVGQGTWTTTVCQWSPHPPPPHSRHCHVRPTIAPGCAEKCLDYTHNNWRKEIERRPSYGVIYMMGWHGITGIRRKV